MRFIMKTPIYDNLNDSEVALKLLNGGIGIIPTDTVYGIVCIAKESEINRMYKIRGRPTNQKSLLLVSSESDIEEFGPDINQLEIAKKYWPGPLTAELAVRNAPKFLDKGSGRLAFRVPDFDELEKLLKLTGPLIAPSANPQGVTPHASTLEDAISYFDDKVDFYVDGGDLSNNKESTIIGFVLGNNIKIYREGAVEILREEI